jgi:AraC-like DNA-binding protein
MNNSRLKHIQNWPEWARVANWSAATLAQNCGVSLRTLERHFLKEIGKSPKKWLAEQRQQRAFELIQDGSRVKETAALLDYKHPNHLTNAFTKCFGHCPTDKTSQTRAQNP